MSRALTEFDPRWAEQDGRIVGLTFACPRCAAAGRDPDACRVAVAFEPGLDGGPGGTFGGKAWQRTGDTFDTITLTPSILVYEGATQAEHWHGFVTNGQVTP